MGWTWQSGFDAQQNKRNFLSLKLPRPTQLPILRCNRLSNLPDFGCNDFEARRKHESLSRNIQEDYKPLCSSSNSLFVAIIQLTEFYATN